MFWFKKNRQKQKDIIMYVIGETLSRDRDLKTLPLDKQSDVRKGFDETAFEQAIYEKTCKKFNIK